MRRKRCFSISLFPFLPFVAIWVTSPLYTRTLHGGRKEGGNGTLSAGEIARGRERDDVRQGKYFFFFAASLFPLFFYSAHNSKNYAESFPCMGFFRFPKKHRNGKRRREVEIPRQASADKKGGGPKKKEVSLRLLFLFLRSFTVYDERRSEEQEGGKKWRGREKKKLFFSAPNPKGAAALSDGGRTRE